MAADGQHEGDGGAPRGDGRSSSAKGPGKRSGKRPSRSRGKGRANITRDRRGVRNGEAGNGAPAKAGRSSAPEQPLELARPVFFVGFMGAGKTSVSRYIARRWNLSAIDLDTYLERREGRVIRDIFAEDGEEAFRAIEADVLREVGQSPSPSLVSCGGGVVERSQNRSALGELGTVVYLRVSADEAASRISNKSSRPLFNDLENARALCERRSPLYEEAADIVVDTAGKSVGQIGHEVVRALKRRGALRACKEDAS